jgi:8-oxo-dGTP diphosphatase
MSALQPSADHQDIPMNALHRPAVTVDVVTLTIIEGDLHVLLEQRRDEPFANRWVIPGRFIGQEEGLEAAARTELIESAHIDNIYLEQLYTFGDPHRDPRLRVITVVYYALVDAARLSYTTQHGTGTLQWYPMSDLPLLGFDHAQILHYTLQRLRGKLEYTTIGFQLLPPQFTLSELQVVYEAILGRKLDKRNFRKKILATSILAETDRTKMEGPHRPARLYRFHPDAVRE